MDAQALSILRGMVDAEMSKVAGNSEIDPPYLSGGNFRHWFDLIVKKLQISQELWMEILTSYQLTLPQEVPRVAGVFTKTEIAEGWAEGMVLKSRTEFVLTQKHPRSQRAPKNSKLFLSATHNRDPLMFAHDGNCYPPANSVKLKQWRLRNLKVVPRVLKLELTHVHRAEEASSIKAERQGYETADTFIVLDLANVLGVGDPYYRVTFLRDRQKGELIQVQDKLKQSDVWGLHDIALKPVSDEKSS